MSNSFPAKALCREGELGVLTLGAVADIVVSQLAEGEFVYMDVLYGKMYRLSSLRVIMYFKGVGNQVP